MIPWVYDKIRGGLTIFTLLGIEVFDDRYVLVRGSAHPPVIKNGGALRTDRIPSGPIIGGWPRAPRVHYAISPIVLESRNDISIRSVVLYDIVDDWCRGHFITLKESCLDCRQQLRVYLYRNRGILSWITVDCLDDGRTFLAVGLALRLMVVTWGGPYLLPCSQSWPHFGWARIRGQLDNGAKCLTEIFSWGYWTVFITSIVRLSRLRAQTGRKWAKFVDFYLSFFYELWIYERDKKKNELQAFSF